MENNKFIFIFTFLFLFFSIILYFFYIDKFLNKKTVIQLNKKIDISQHKFDNIRTHIIDIFEKIGLTTYDIDSIYFEDQSKITIKYKHSITQKKYDYYQMLIAGSIEENIFFLSINNESNNDESNNYIINSNNKNEIYFLKLNEHIYKSNDYLSVKNNIINSNYFKKNAFEKKVQELHKKSQLENNKLKKIQNDLKNDEVFKIEQSIELKDKENKIQEINKLKEKLNEEKKIIELSHNDLRNKINYIENNDNLLNILKKKNKYEEIEEIEEI